jgi:hypothetical protein
MNDHAYDISHLLDSEPAKVEAPELRIVRTPPPSSAAASIATVQSIAATQDAMARELMLVDVAHEALIQQYLRMSGYSIQNVADQ